MFERQVWILFKDFNTICIPKLNETIQKSKNDICMKRMGLTKLHARFLGISNKFHNNIRGPSIKDVRNQGGGGLANVNTIVNFCL